MDYRIASLNDLEILTIIDDQISPDKLTENILLERIYMLTKDNEVAGFLRYGFLWDNIPFLNLLFLLERYRGDGFGRQAVALWEAQMKEMGYQRVLTSTLSTEEGQFFFRKIGYQDCGALIFPGQPTELVLQKELR